MGQSLVKNYLHIIYSTKYRQPLIHEKVQPELYSYLGGICNSLECFPLKIGGHKEHVHILSHFSKKITVIKFLEELKSHSSNWIKTQHARYGDFFWQGGYGAFSVSPQSMEIVKQYIDS